MSEFSKVVWAEGTYLSPQHFQQNDRYTESKLQSIVNLAQAHYYGVFDLGFNDSLLKQGVVSLSRLEMVFEDGTVFIPTPLEVDSLEFNMPANIAETKLYLVITRVTASSNEIAYELDDIKNTRYSAFEKPLLDTTDTDSDPRVVTLAKLNVRLMLEDNIHSSLVKIPIAIVSSNDNSEVEIQASYIAPTLIAQKNSKLYNYINELYGLLAQKSKSLANAVNDPNRGGSLEITDFLMLQTVNRYLAYMQHQKQPTNHTHPEALFVSLSKLCGDLMTFLPTRKMGDMPVYDHRNLKECYQHLMSNLRISLSTILEQRIIRIDLSKKDSATYVAQTPNAEILEIADFVLAVKADMPNETLRHNLPSIMKISTVEQIKELVAYHLPGVKLNALSVAPRELPYHNGYVYFELDKQTEIWERFDDSSGMAFHVAGDFPNIDLEFWAIKPNIK